MELTNLWPRLRAWARADVQCYLYQCSLELMMQTAPPPYPGVDFYACTDETLPEVKRAITNLPRLIERRVQRGDMALMAAHAGSWVFRSTAVLGPKIYSMDGYPLVLTSQDAYLECAETVPDWRGKGVAPGMLLPTARALCARGIQKVYMAIEVTNTASCRAAEKGGCRRVGLITSRRRYGRWTAAYQPIAEEATLLPDTTITT